MKKIKILKFTLAILLAISLTITCFAIDESNNQTGTDTGLSKAEPGNAQVQSASVQQATTMWKISVFAAKNDKVGRGANESLTEDYYQFGSTFWIYRKSGDYAVKFNENDYICTKNKEEYQNDDSFRKGTYKSLSYRIFAGEDYGFSNDSASTRVPYVPNCGSVSGMTNEQIISAMNTFFKDNANTSNVLFNLAAMASGYKKQNGKMPYEQLLEKMISDGKFTVNGNVLKSSQFNLIDPYREKINGAYEKEASTIAYVIMYEPVLRFAMSGDASSDKYYVTASDVAVLQKNGIVNFNESMNSMFFRFSPSFKKEHGVSVIDSEHIMIDGKTYSPVIKNCTTPFFINLANSVYLESSWLGYTPPVISSPRNLNDDLWSIGSDRYAWYTDTMLKRAGFGLRFIKSDVQTVEIEKKVEADSESLKSVDFSKFEFVITDSGSGEKYIVNVDGKGLGKIVLRPGNYTIEENAVKGFVFDDFTSDTIKLENSGELSKFILDGKKGTVKITAHNVKKDVNIKIRYYDDYTQKELSQADYMTDKKDMDIVKPYGEDYDIKSLVDNIYEGYSFVKNVIYTEKAAPKGTAVKDFEVSVYLGKVHNISINYFDKYSGDIIFRSYERKGVEPGENVSISENKYEEIATDNIAYELDCFSINGVKEDDYPAEFEMPDNDVRLDLFYKYDDVLTVFYKDADTKEELVPSFEIPFEHLSEYDALYLTQLTIADYDRIEETTGDLIKGVMDGDKEITVWYRKIKIPLNPIPTPTEEPEKPTETPPETTEVPVSPSPLVTPVTDSPTFTPETETPQATKVPFEPFGPPEETPEISVIKDTGDDLNGMMRNFIISGITIVLLALVFLIKAIFNKRKY